MTALPTTATAIRFDREQTVSLGSHPLPACGPSDLVVETLYTMISPGTELRMLAGHYGAAGRFPYVPGYNSIARVIATGLVVTLTLESLAYFKRFAFPAGVTGTAVALVLSMLVFLVVSWLTRARAAGELDPDVRLVMEV